MRNFARVAIIGSTGQLGNDLLEAFSDREVIALAHEDLCIENAAQVEDVIASSRPSLVLNTAAYHNVPKCETEQEQALRINALGVQNVAQACAKRNIAFGTISTDYVFDGAKGSPYTEQDQPHPLSVYGISKLAGEMLAAAIVPGHFIFRTSGLFGKLGSKSKGYTFIDRVLQQAAAGEPISVVDDMWFSPSYTRHVAQWIRKIVDRAPFGIYHVTNSGSCSWHEFAVEAIATAGLSAHVRAISSADFASPVRRPRNSALGHAALLAAGIEDLPHWKAAVAEYLKERTFSRTPLS
ncbi:MAG: dTDP-4-dehydrorhamnose reductase [Candidatus Eremiobacteraeota bacterium]|nr:dTDP-4-dehydrorhamnose reductase [Candidatus Eremiobacteraeota bacterium]